MIYPVLQSNRVIRILCLTVFLILFTVHSASVAICCCNSFSINLLPSSPLGHCYIRTKVKLLVPIIPRNRRIPRKKSVMQLCKSNKEVIISELWRVQEVRERRRGFPRTLLLGAAVGRAFTARPIYALFVSRWHIRKFRFFCCLMP